MPDYRYRCNDCEIFFTVTQHIDDNHDAAPCPRCEQPGDRAWTVPVLVFRGPGFSLALQGETEPKTDELCDGIEGLESMGVHMA
jgi:putative FmdB family regulatory protein